MIDKTQITQQAKRIMDNFVSALSKAEETNPEFRVKRLKNMREASAAEDNKDFRDRMFKNAPKVLNECIIAEKKRW